MSSSLSTGARRRCSMLFKKPPTGAVLLSAFPNCEIGCLIAA